LLRVERLREKLMQYGPEKLSNSELLAIILRSGAKKSEDDLEMTKRLVEAGKILGIEVIDHIIITKRGFISFKEKGLI